MTIVRDLVQTVQRINTPRLPLGGARLGTFANPEEATGLLSQLNQPANVPWIFAVVDRIASSVAATKWTLDRVSANGDKTEIVKHPFLDLWHNWNPWITHEEGLEIIQQHLCLTGEGWLVKVRDGLGITRELWPVRPDRMTVVPSKDYIAGYVYHVGTDKIPLQVEDVVFIRRPSPVDPYRGQGPLQALMSDLQGDKAASRYNMYFFQNNAEPGGILKFENNLSDMEFERLVARWNTQHRGVSNAHRIAVIERGEWVERKYTQRDMDFLGLRNFTRDLILGAFGVPRAVMGITEDVNRANAEAGMFLFAHWVVRPQLRRLRAGLNDRLVKDFGTDLELNFLDPTPENREANLLEATQGYREGLLTLNEGRALLGEGEVPEGDAFKAPAPSPFTLSYGQAKMLKAGPDPEEIRPEQVDQEDLRMARNWIGRLAQEKRSLLAFLAGVTEPPSIETYDWDWWAKYSEAVIGELERAFREAALAMFPKASPDIVQLRAAMYAELRAGRLLKLSGDVSLTEYTRARVRDLIAENLLSGQGLGSLAKKIQEDDIFSKARARTIARTETTQALGQGQKQVAMALGRSEKRWLSQGDELVRPEHKANEAQGWIGIGQAFKSGQDTIGDGPAELTVNCRCTVIYRTAEKGFTPIKTDFPLENRCPECSKLLAKESLPAERYCRACKKQVVC